MRKLIRICLMSALVLATGAGCGDSTGSYGYPIVVAVTLLDTEGNPVVAINQDNTLTGSLALPRNSELDLRVQLRTASGPVEPTEEQTVRVLVTHSRAVTWAGSWDGEGTLTAGPDAGTARLHVDVITLGAVTYTSREIVVTVT